MTKNILLITVFCCFFITLTGQQLLHKNEKPGTGFDSSLTDQLPELRLTTQMLRTTLPVVVDNSTHPFMRPVFNQVGASCGQAASVGYNFTYEMCRARNLSASDSNNQFPSHFVYNFNNYNSWFGVNYRHSFEVLTKMGTPTLADYGGMANDEDGTLWLSGYEKYYNAMKNRARKAYRIDVSTPEGLLTLKHWLAHHHENSPYGGLANFDAASPWGSGMQQLPDDSPQAGKLVMAWFPLNYATHAMTIVGYNDSIRLDINDDGLYTNHLDINNDGLVDMRDWEIGGLKFVNSYGSDWADDGYCYMLYRTLAENVYYGGIWDNQVYVVDVRETYEPDLTIRFRISHNQREQIRLVAGIAADTSANQPEHRLYFPVFNFQGGPNFMQGKNTHDSLMVLEAGLDITSLLDHATPDQPVAIFLQIDEDDPASTGSGEMQYFSVRDYSGISFVETVSSDSPVILNNNDVTYLKVIISPEFSKTQILTEEIFLEDDTQQLLATGGTEPYTWTLETPYFEQVHHNAFPEINDVQLIPEQPNLKFARQSLPFSFPFFGETYDEIFVHVDGFLMFEPGIYPWPYYQDTYLMFRTIRNISGFMFRPIRYQPETRSDEGIWYRGDTNRADFRWKQPLMFGENEIGFAEFAVSIFPDGSIEFYYNNIKVDENITWYAGVSSGDRNEFRLLNGSLGSFLPEGTARRLTPLMNPDEISLNENGYLAGLQTIGNNFSNISVKVSDDMGISSRKTYQVSELLNYNLTYETSDGLPPRSGSEINVHLEIKNLTDETLENLVVELNSSDVFSVFTQSVVNGINVPANDTILVEDAFSFLISSTCPDKQHIPLSIQFTNSTISLSGLNWIQVMAPDLLMHEWQFTDGDNDYPDPGETGPVSLIIKNKGSLTAHNTTLVLTTDDPYVSLNEPYEFTISSIEPAMSDTAIFNISISNQCPIDHEAILVLSMLDGDSLITQVTFSVFIGQYPVLVFNKAKNDVSSQILIESLEDMYLPYIYVETLPDRLALYRSVFVCLGSANQYTSLSEAEGEKLAEYLENGGRLYMEGSYAWNFSVQTKVHQKFLITGFVLGAPLSLNSIVGFDDQFASGLSFPFNNVNDFLYIGITPTSPAFAVMYPDTDPMVNTMIANEQSVFKTVGSQLEFSNYGFEEDAENRRELLYQILHFFDLSHLITVQQEQYEPNKPAVTITAYPNPFMDECCINFGNEIRGNTTVTIRNSQGTIINHIETGPGNAHMICWDGKNLNGSPSPSGIYYATIISRGVQKTVMLVRVRQ
jgi:hypothetical protein